MEKLDSFTKAYIQAALWSSTDDAGLPLDSIYGPSDLAPETQAAIVKDCARFLVENEATIYSATCSRGSGLFPQIERAGHDFWLTRNGHGAGFWDGDWSEPEAAQLTAASKKFGEVDLYVGDDGLIYA
jgi:hypothetical protein